MRKSVWERSGSRLRCTELSVDSAENLELIVFAETCSGAWFWIEYVIPIRIGWTIRRPPTDGTVVDLSDRKQSVQSGLHVVVVEHAFASNELGDATQEAMPSRGPCLEIRRRGRRQTAEWSRDLPTGMLKRRAL